MITVDNIVKVYSGRTGCMCGCNGTYRTTDRAKKMALTKMLKENYTLQLWGDTTAASGGSNDVGCMYVETRDAMGKGRCNAIYLKGPLNLAGMTLEIKQAA